MKHFLLLISVLAAFAVQAQWSTDPAVNTPISIAPDYQDLPQIISDGSGGSIITWVDWRNPPLNMNGDIYAQRIGTNGVVQWTTDGVPVYAATGTQNRPMIVSDGSGGAIIVWEDLRNGSTNDIYAQRINSSGAAQWAANGIPVCMAIGEQSRPMIATDGASGAIITWYSHPSSGIYSIYAQRINGNGVAQWSVNGVALCPDLTSQIDPKIISDGAGGAIVVWKDNRTNTYTDIYAQRINRSGVLKWITGGVGICVMARQQWAPSIAPDGSGGAIIAWADQRSTTSDDIYAQRIDSSGNHLWVSDGVPIATGGGDQQGPIVLAFKDGSAIITWNDERNGSSNRDIYTQRIGSSGAAVWPTDGVSICSAANNQDWANPVSDGNGGAIISWEDERLGGSSRNVYAQRVNINGAVQWASNGVAISTATGYKSFSTILPAGAGDAIIAWGDERNGSNDRNIFAQRVMADGSLGGSTSIAENPMPDGFSLYQNYPNPFNPSTTIRYRLPHASFVKLTVYNTFGQQVSQLVNEQQQEGNHEVVFHGNQLPSGTYFYRLQADDNVSTKKMTLFP